jgi:hypothetical protein
MIASLCPTALPSDKRSKTPEFRRFLDKETVLLHDYLIRLSAGTTEPLHKNSLVLYDPDLMTGNQERACPFCDGSGECGKCGGTGFRELKPSRIGRTRPVKCWACDASGKCPLCHGTGKQQSGQPSRGNEEEA